MNLLNEFHRVMIEQIALAPRTLCNLAIIVPLYPSHIRDRKQQRKEKRRRKAPHRGCQNVDQDASQSQRAKQDNAEVAAGDDSHVLRQQLQQLKQENELLKKVSEVAL
jgi:hypothetical protein